MRNLCRTMLRRNVRPFEFAGQLFWGGIRRCLRSSGVAAISLSAVALAALAACRWGAACADPLSRPGSDLVVLLMP